MTKKLTPQEQQMLQEIEDKKMAKKLEEAYNKSLTNTAPAPAPAPMPAASAPKRMASGGYVKAADGVAQRGKTRGKMC
jgi:hypothetical protein